MYKWLYLILLTSITRDNHMQRVRFPFSILLLLFIGISCQNSHVLFEENKKNWVIEGDAEWNFINGELTGIIKSGSGFIMTTQSYKDFVLELEFKPDSTINSGVFIRCSSMDIDAISCYELNIWDLHPNQDFRTGAIVTRSVPLKKVETRNNWNQYKIKIKDDHILVWINGILTADMRDKTLIKGYIGLQAAGSGKISFRNIRINNL